jgi:predicted DNA-binding transcriptional regulator YafY
MKLFNIFKSIILEEVSMDVIIDAIRKRKVLIINYQGDEPGGNGLRQIEPVCLGISKAGNRVLRAWDSEGASHTAYLGKQPLPSWRLFRLDKILSANPTGDIYNEPRPNYNFNGDDSMVRVLVNAKFENLQPQTA